MSKKSPKIAALISHLSHPELDAHYLGYFECFNHGLYYEAHDVLEELWLEQGKTGPNYSFYKGLIQCAGAFVHMKKHFEHPKHPVHGRRLEPAGRLLKLALANTRNYSQHHMGIDLNELWTLCTSYLEKLHPGSSNPWNPSQMPVLQMPRVDSQGPS